jgi:hypothetical protein
MRRHDRSGDKPQNYKQTRSRHRENRGHAPVVAEANREPHDRRDGERGGDQITAPRP